LGLVGAACWMEEQSESIVNAGLNAVLDEWAVRVLVKLPRQTYR
jgi:hypothetical protein